MYGHFTINYIKPLIIGKHLNTAQSYGALVGFPIINNSFTQCTLEYNKNLYKLGNLCFFSTLFLLVCLQVCVAYISFLRIHFEKKSKITMNLAPEKYECSKVRMRRESFPAKKIMGWGCH